MNANLMSKKIEMTKKEAKAAGKIGSDEFKNLRQLMEMYPGYEIQIKTPAKRKAEFLAKYPEVAKFGTEAVDQKENEEEETKPQERLHLASKSAEENTPVELDEVS